MSRTRSNNSTYNPLAPAVEEAIKLLEFIASRPNSEVSLNDIRDNLGISGGRAYSLLHTLQLHQLIAKKISTKRYSLGLGFLSYGQLVLQELQNSDDVSSLLQNLADKTKCTAVETAAVMTPESSLCNLDDTERLFPQVEIQRIVDENIFG